MDHERDGAGWHDRSGATNQGRTLRQCHSEGCANISDVIRGISRRQHGWAGCGETIVRDDYQDGVSTVITSGRDTQDTNRPATVEHFLYCDLKGATANTPYKSETQYPRSSLEPVGKGDAS